MEYTTVSMENEAQMQNKVAILGVNVCFAIVSLFVKSFLVARIFDLTGASITAVCIFIFLDITGILVFYAISTWVTKRINPVTVVQFSALVACVFIMLILVFEGDLGRIYFYFGAGWGILQGIYWAAINYATADAFTPKNIIRYNLWFFVFTSSASIIFPITFGFAIDHASFLLTTAIVFAIGVALVLFSMLIRIEKRPRDRMKYVEYGRFLCKNDLVLRQIWAFIFTFWGGFQYTCAYILTILILLVYGTNTSIGLFGTIFALVGIAWILLYRNGGRFLRAPMFWLGAVAPLCMAATFLFQISALTIILFNGAIAIRNVVENEHSNARFNFAKQVGDGKYIRESLVLTEASLYVGRICSVAALMGAGLLGGTQMVLAAAIIVITLGTTLQAVSICVFNHTKSSRV